MVLCTVTVMESLLTMRVLNGFKNWNGFTFYSQSCVWF